MKAVSFPKLSNSKATKLIPKRSRNGQRHGKEAKRRPCQDAADRKLTLSLGRKKVQGLKENNRGEQRRGRGRVDKGSGEKYREGE